MMTRTSITLEEGNLGKNMKNIHDLFVSELKLMYDAEKQIVKALPKVIEAVSSKELKSALKSHLEETRGQVKRLEMIFKELHLDSKSLASEAMEHLLKEADKVIESDYQVNVKDAALINCAQHVEHFEIASYGILKSLAKSFEYDHVLELLEENSKEEGHANKKLSEIAEGTIFNKGVNTKAIKRAA